MLVFFLGDSDVNVWVSPERVIQELAVHVFLIIFTCHVRTFRFDVIHVFFPPHFSSFSCLPHLPSFAMARHSSNTSAGQQDASTDPACRSGELRNVGERGAAADVVPSGGESDILGQKYHMPEHIVRRFAR